MIFLDPENLDQALAMKADHPEATPLAGGTDLLPLWSREGPEPERVLSLARCQALKKIHAEKEGFVLGSLATHAEIAAHQEVKKTLPALAQAAASIGAPAIRNMGTLGGNLVTASPAADLPPVLMAYGAEVRVVSKERGERTIPLDLFFTAYRTTGLKPDELVKEVVITHPDARMRSFFRKVGARKAQACAKASLAVAVVLDGSSVERFSAAAGSVAPVCLRLEGVEAFVTGQPLTPELAHAARQRAAAETGPVDDIRSTADYRRFVVGALLEDGLLRLVKDPLSNP